MRGRASLALLAALALGLAACGGGGSSSSSTAASTEASAPATPKPHALSVAELAAERRKAARAASFVAPESDNSVPTFGSEAGTMERDQAETALKDYLRARARGDWASACAYLAAPTRQGYEKLGASSSKASRPGCAEVLAALSKGADLSNPLIGRLLSLRVQEASAFALFYGPHHQQYIVPMNREGNTWRPTQAAPIAYPPGARSTTSP
jgi:hypothetical protein